MSCLSRFLLYFSLFFAAIPIAFSQTERERLAMDIQQALSESPIANHQLSIWVAPIDTGKPILTFQSQTPRLPASVTKIITTGAGLFLLGKGYRWKTEFYTHAAIKNGVLLGDLIIKGYGNPYMVEERLPTMIDKLRRLGIREIHGDIILDNSYFLSQYENPDAFDGKGTAPYNALPNALSINFRTVQLVIGVQNGKIVVRTNPPLLKTRIENQLYFNTNRRCSGKGFSPTIQPLPNHNTIVLSGSISRYCTEKKLTKILSNAEDLFFSHFRKAWLASGGVLKSQWRYGKVKKQDRLLTYELSKPLYQQIIAMNKFSNNLMTRQLFLTLGAELTQPPATLKKSRAVIIEALHRLGVSTRQLFIDNGSGLSRQTTITATQVGQFLLAMQKIKNIRPYFENSLAIAGIDGTLKRRLRQSPLKGNVIAKTGTLNQAKSIAGYLTAQSGRRYAYAILVNGPRAKNSTSLMDKVLLWTYNNN